MKMEHLPVFTSRKIAVNGIVLNVIVEGQGPAVMLVHGFPDDHDVWRRQIPALVDAGFRVIAPDNRGCGDSDAPLGTRAYRLDWLVADLAGVLDALGIDKVRLVGHDWGALIGWAFCMAHPQRVDRYMALSVGHPAAYARAPLKQKLMGWYVLFLQVRGVAEWALRAFGWRGFRAFASHVLEHENWIIKLARPGRLTAAINVYRANLSLVLPRAMPKVGVPVMGVWSSGDRYLCEAQMRDSGKWVTGPWRFVRIDGVSHWLQLEAPERINPLMLEYLR